MLFLSAFLISLALSVAAIPLSLPRSPLGLDSLKSLPGVPVVGGLLTTPAEVFKLGKKKPKPGYEYSKKNLFGRFIMDADYASGSGPPAFFGKSPHKRQLPLSNSLDSTPLPINDPEELITQLSSRSTST